jgi:PmbA protein
MTVPDDLSALAGDLVTRALHAGADVAEVKARRGWELTVRVRSGETELVQEAGHRSVAMRVLRGSRMSVTSSSDLTPSGLARLVADALELVELSEPDTFAGPADPGLLAVPPYPDLDLYDEALGQIEAQRAIEIARTAERAAFDYDPRIALSEGASFSRVDGESALVLSTGFSGTQRGSYASLTVTPVAMDADDKRRRGFYWSARRHLEDLEPPIDVGREAARRTLAQLGPRRVPTGQYPVVFSPDVARSLIGTFAGCILGGSIWRRSSYLVDREGEAVASPLVTIVDDPLIARAPGSRPFDGEGLPSRLNLVVEDGVLRTYLLDTYAARKLNRTSTASAGRGGASVSPSTSNFILRPGSTKAADIVASTESGLYVTEMMGFGFNPITGDYSRGASGFWIENGRLTHPVSEVTVSSNLDAMLRDIDAVGDDLDLKTSTASPTFRVAQMTIAGT